MSRLIQKYKAVFADEKKEREREKKRIVFDCKKMSWLYWKATIQFKADTFFASST